MSSSWYVRDALLIWVGVGLGVFASIHFFSNEAVFDMVQLRGNGTGRSTHSLACQRQHQDVVGAHSCWKALVSSLDNTYELNREGAVNLDDLAIASLHDLLDSQTGHPPEEYGTLTTEEADRVSRMPIHVISSPHASDRKSLMDIRLKRHGFKSWKYHSKWDTEAVKISRNESADYMGHTFRTDFEAPVYYYHANFMEHVEALKEIASLMKHDNDTSGTTFSLIIEDDSIMTPFFKNRLAWFTSEFLQNVGAVFFGGCLHLHAKSPTFGARWGTQSIDPEVHVMQHVSSISPSTSPKHCYSSERRDAIVACLTPVNRATPTLIPLAKTRCVSGYAVKPEYAARLLPAIRKWALRYPATTAVDLAMNEVLERMQEEEGLTQVYHLEPPASYETSKVFMLQPRDHTVFTSLNMIAREFLVGQ